MSKLASTPAARTAPAPASLLAPSAFDPWQAVLARIDDALDLAGVDPDLAVALRACERVLEVTVPVRMDDGHVEVFTGWRIHHNTARGPAKGGIRFHPDVHRHEIAALAADMSLKTAVVGIPFGGGKGGVAVDPRRLSVAELERLTRRYTFEISSLLGPDRDVPAPDVNTDERVMAWLLDTMDMLHGRDAMAAVVTGKPLAVGGMKLHAGATASGVLRCVLATFERLGIATTRASAVVQGFGKVGGPLAFLLASAGVRVVAVADIDGAVYNPGGLDVAALSAHAAAHRSVAGFPGADPIDPTELWQVRSTVAVPAALEGALTAEVAATLAAPVVVEAANGPTTLEADAVLADRGVWVVPDILANAGGVTASYFEWAQSRQGFPWDEQVVAERLAKVVDDAFEATWAKAQALGVSMRRAAGALAVSRIAEAAGARGLFP